MSKTLSAYLLAGTALMAAAMPAQAADKAVKSDDESTTVQLNAEARKMVQQDRVLATLSFEATGKTSAEVQAALNTKMQGAKTLYDTASGVKASTGAYNVFKDYEPEPAPKKDGTSAWTPEEREQHSFWRGTQELRLDGAKSDALLQLIANLQKQGFAASGLNFYMSRAAEDSVKDALIVEALGNIKARAENIRQALGMKTIRYAKIDLDNSGAVRPMPMMARGMMMKTDMAADAAALAPAPVAEAGETEVVVNVTAEVKLK